MTIIYEDDVDDYDDDDDCLESSPSSSEDSTIQSLKKKQMVESSSKTSPIEYYVTKDSGCYYVVDRVNKLLQLRLIINPNESYLLPWPQNIDTIVSKMMRIPVEIANLNLKKYFLILTNRYDFDKAGPEIRV